MEIKKITDNEIEITTEIKQVRIKEDLEREKEEALSRKQEIEKEIAEIDKLLEHF